MTHIGGKGLLLLSLLLTACQPPGVKADGSPAFTPAERQIIYSLSPLPSPPANPSNRYADQPAAARLGQTLFYEPRLSANGKLACASCHQPAKGWADGLPQAKGLQTTRRHSPSLWNVAYQRWYFWDGRADSLWAQAIQPLEDPKEMGMPRLALLAQFQQQPDLQQAYQQVFGPLPTFAANDLSPAAQQARNQFVSHLGKALEAFERQIVSQPAPFDRFVAGLKKQDEAAQQALSPDAQKGLRLFIGRAQCVLCHTGPAFSDGEFHNLGLPATAIAADQGRAEGIPRLQQDPFNALGALSDLPSAEHPWADKLHYLALQASNQGEFRTPSLREVAQTAPYMHDGRFQTLDQVLAFYNTASAHTPAVGRREDTVQSLNLTAEELQQLKAFLMALSSAGPDPRLIQAVPSQP